MKEFKFSRKSWHYRLANFGSDRVWRDDDICNYIRSVIAGAILFVGMLIMLFLLGTLAIFSVYNAIEWLFFGGELLPPTILFFGVVGGLGLIAACAIFLDWRRTHHVEKEPGFVGLAYRSWKNKFCAKVSFE